MTIDKKIIAIIVLSILVLVFGWIAFKPSPPPYDMALIHSQIKALDSANVQLGKEIQEERKKSALYEFKIDSLSKLEPIIITKYVDRYKKIDNASAIAISNEFSTIFANAGIGQK
jgi:hypothetical protein